MWSRCVALRCVARSIFNSLELSTICCFGFAEVELIRTWLSSDERKSAQTPFRIRRIRNLKLKVISVCRSVPICRAQSTGLPPIELCTFHPSDVSLTINSLLFFPCDVSLDVPCHIVIILTWSHHINSFFCSRLCVICDVWRDSPQLRHSTAIQRWSVGTVFLVASNGTNNQKKNN